MLRRGIMKKKIPIILLFIIGIAIFFYPTVSNLITSRNSSKVINEYDDKVSRMSKKDREKEKERAKAYNDSLTNLVIKDPFSQDASATNEGDSYANYLNIGEAMAYIVIPKISVKLPIYHGFSERVLQKGIGHVPNTSLPIPGKETHSVLTGHSGLPEAKLFTDLNKLHMGDEFYIQVIDEINTYSIDKIDVLEPENIKAFEILPGENYVTLITCTPYAVNSHRLLIRGTLVNTSTRDKGEIIQEEDVSIVEEGKEEINETFNLDKYKIIISLFIIALILVAISSIIWSKRQRKKRLHKHDDK